VVNTLDETREENFIINNVLKNELLNLDNMNDIPFYIGKKELINHLIEIQKENVYKIFSSHNIYSHIKNEIKLINKKLSNIPEACKNQEEMTEKIEECMESFSETLFEDLNRLDCDENGEPNKHLLKFILDTKFKSFIKYVKEKMNELLKESFCKNVSYNIKETNAGNIPIFKDSIPYPILLKPEIKRILNGYETKIIKDVFEVVVERIYYVIDTSFEGYDNLKSEIKKLYEKKAYDQLKEVINFYKLIKNLEINNIFTLNKEVIIKANNINQDINYSIMEEKFNEYNNGDYESPVRFATDFTKDVLESNLGEAVKNAFQKIGDNIDFSFKINSNYEKEKKFKQIQYDEKACIIKISYHPQNISEFNQKITINDMDDKTDTNDEKDKNLYEFIPGYDYIKKENLNNFKELIKNKKIPLTTANVITEFIAYLEVMIDRFLDMLFMSIRSNLYSNLTDNKTINDIHDQLKKLNFESNKDLMGISTKMAKEKKEYEKRLENLYQAEEILQKLKSDNK